MSDMSFKQAKELTEQFELAQLSLSQTLKKIDKVTKDFDESVKQQEKIIQYMPQLDKKLEVMKIVIALNVGFVLGLLSAKFIL
jgi:ABC-type dipeptide/oligopeptide/nickel transport system permease component